MEIEGYFWSKRTDLFHILDIIRQRQWLDDDIADQLVALYKAGKIAFAYQGDFPICGNVNSWTDEQWQEAQKNGTFLNSLLRANYRSRIKKRELVSIGKIMRKIQSKIPRIELSWGYVRYKK